MRWVILIVTTSLFATSASAQDAEIDIERARTVFEAGRIAYEDGRFEEALSLFRSCYEATRQPVLLYNIAMSADRLRRDEDALNAYEQYLPTAPADQQADISSRIEALRRVIAEHAVVEVPEVTEPEPEPEPILPIYPPSPPSVVEAHPRRTETDRSIATALLIGSSAVAVGGGVLAAFGVADWSTVDGAEPGSSWSAHEEAYDRSQTVIPVGGAILTAGVIGIVVALVVLLSED